MVASIAGDVARVRGVGPLSKKVYTAAHRPAFIEQLPGTVRPAAELLYAQYDALVPVKAAAQQQLVAEYLVPFLEKLEPVVSANRAADFYAGAIKFIIGYLDLEKGLSDHSD